MAKQKKIVKADSYEKVQDLIYDYKNKGYFNAEAIIEMPFIFNYITGARGIGKTYGCLKYFIENAIPFVYLRRTQVEADLQANEKASSITKILNDLKVGYTFSKVAKNVGVIYVDDKPLIYTVALSTFSSIRGIEFNVNYILYDEFIPEPHVRSIKAEGMALNNLYESINRNRELDGLKPVKLICLSNSLNIANDIFISNDLITAAERLTNMDEEEAYFRGDVMLIICKHSPISDLKRETALYKNASEEFSAMALENKFILNDFTYVKNKIKLVSYKVVLQVGDLYLYKHKKNKKDYYVSFTKATTKNKYTTSQADLERFRRAEWRYWVKYLDGYIRFDSYKAIALFEKYYNI